MADCVIVGGGLAGLTAAHALRDRNILLLEAADRPGGRILSHARPPYWLNLGAHMAGGPGSIVGDLVRELGLASEPIRGALLGIAMDRQRILGAPVDSFPLLLPLPFAARLSLVKLGIALRLGSAAVVRAMRPRPGETPAETRARVLAHDDHRTLAESVGRLHPHIASLLTAMTERTGGDPAVMAAGYALRSFTNVWSRHSPGRNLIGGSSQLPLALAAQLGERFRANSPVAAIEEHDGIVTVTAGKAGNLRRYQARTCIVATPAHTTRAIVRRLPAETAAALAAVTYGAFLSVAVLTDETSPMPWDRMYAIATPKRSFSVLFNQATTLRAREKRERGGSLMLFRGARGAERLMSLSDRAIEATFVEDLLKEFPEISGHIREIIVGRWPAGAPYAVPGRAALQSALTARSVESYWRATISNSRTWKLLPPRDGSGGSSSEMACRVSRKARGSALDPAKG